MLKQLEYEAVTYRHWVAPEEFISMVSSSFLFPGLTGIKLAALIGYKAAGLAGLLLAIICLNLPGLLMTMVGYHWLTTHDGPITRKVMIGVQYGALALLAAATFSIGQGIVGVYFSTVIALACVGFFIGLAFLNVSPFWGFVAFIGICFFLIK